VSSPVINAEADLFREAGRDFIVQSGSVSLARRLHSDAVPFERNWWQQAAELGWTMLLAPERAGGGSPSGEGVIDLVDIAELCGAHVAPGPLLVTSAIVAGLAQPEARRNHDEVLAGILEGTTVAAWAAPPLAGITPGVTARREGECWVLSGDVEAVEFGSEADVLWIAAESEDGITHFLVPTEHAGVAVVPTGSIDLVRPFARVTFTDALLPDAMVAVDGMHGRAVLRAQLRCMNLLQVAESVGALRRVFEFTVEWGMERYSFGRPLASYQALKHRYADDVTHLYACRALLAAAARAVQDGAPEADRLVSAAKAYVGEVGVQIVQDSCQLHGGLSQTMEHDLHIYLRRVMLCRALYGSVREHRINVARTAFEGEA
jgi:alkylation response protein AidB-like acyl-CoA dehydrogenase